MSFFEDPRRAPTCIPEAVTLLAERDPGLRATLAALLRAAGFNVVTVRNAQELEDQFDELDDVELIVTDSEMPQQEGLVAAHAIRLRAPLVPIVVMSDQPITRPLIARAHHVGLDAIVPKPIDLHELRTIVDRVYLSRYAGARGDLARLRQSDALPRPIASRERGVHRTPRRRERRRSISAI